MTPRRCRYISIPDWHPRRLNELRGRHWSREHAAKREAADMLGAYGAMQEVPRATGKRRVYLVLIGLWRGGKPDQDAYQKVTLDALVRSGYLLDDGERGLVGAMKAVYHRGPQRRTVVVLEDVL